jgi:hypothetical protein
MSPNAPPLRSYLARNRRPRLVERIERDSGELDVPRTERRAEWMATVRQYRGPAWAGRGRQGAGALGRLTGLF